MAVTKSNINNLVTTKDPSKNVDDYKAQYGTPTDLGYTKAQLRSLDPEKLYDIFAAAALAAKNQSITGLTNAKNYYANSVGMNQDAMIAATRKANAAAIASGQSRGMMDAQLLSEILGMQQTSAEGATKLAQQESDIYAAYGTALSDARVNSQKEAFAAQQALTDQLIALYNTDTAFNTARYTSDSTAFATDLAGILSMLGSINYGATAAGINAGATKEAARISARSAKSAQDAQNSQNAQAKIDKDNATAYGLRLDINNGSINSEEAYLYGKQAGLSDETLAGFGIHVPGKVQTNNTRSGGGSTHVGSSGRSHGGGGGRY